LGRQRQQAVEDQPVVQFVRHAERRGHLPAGAAGHQQQGRSAAAQRQLAVHALDGAGDGEGAAAGQRIAGVGGEVDHLAGRHAQAGRATLQRAQHDAVARQDAAPEEAVLGVQRIDGHCGADHHHQHRSVPATQACQRPRADQGHPAIGAQARRVVVTVAHAAGLAGRHDPARCQVPELKLFLDATAHRVARHIATQQHGRRGQSGPVALGQRIDVLQEHRALRQRLAARAGLGKQGPLEAGVADVDGQQGHARWVWATCGVGAA
jgi:hypothetical protein